MSAFEEIESYETLPRKVATTIAQAGWPIVGKIDIEAGCGIINDGTRCCWNVEGKRITVSMSDGALIVTESRDVDPIYASRKAVNR